MIYKIRNIYINPKRLQMMSLYYENGWHFGTPLTNEINLTEEEYPVAKKLLEEFTECNGGVYGRR